MKAALVFVLCCLLFANVWGFVPVSLRNRCSQLSMVNPKPSGFASTKEGKRKIVERTKALVDESSFIICVPYEGVNKENTDMLKSMLPDSVTASVVKNTLMKLALQESDFDSMSEKLDKENMFLFVPEGETKSTYDAFKKWQKEVNRKDKEFNPRFGAMEGNLYEGQALTDIAGLPSKKELITKIAQGIKAVPTKVGRGINAVPNKLGRAFGAWKDQIKDNGSTPPAASEEAPPAASDETPPAEDAASEEAPPAEDAATE